MRIAGNPIQNTGIPGSHVATIASTMAVVVLFDLVAATLLVLGVCLAGAMPLTPELPLASAPGWVAGHLALSLAIATSVCGGVALGARRLRAPLHRLRAQTQQGGAILRTPLRYLRGVALVQAGAWTCRIGVVYFLLEAFGLHATVPTAALVMIVCGASTLVPLTPGGAGTQQVMLAYTLGQAASAAVIVSFSIGMQLGITAVNVAIGVAAAMVAFRTLHPVAALRSGLRLARAGAA